MPKQITIECFFALSDAKEKIQKLEESLIGIFKERDNDSMDVISLCMEIDEAKESLALYKEAIGDKK